MKKEIVTIQRNEPRSSSWILKDGFEVEHRAVTKLIKKYKSEFEEFGIIASGMQKRIKGSGRPAKIFLLNEEQTYFLGTLLPNTKTVRRFKLILVKNFSIAKGFLYQRRIQKNDPVLIAQRKSGKITRRIETDTIKEFVEYATNQGSTSANRYYANITKMQNKALFLLEQKFKINLRDVLNLNQLATIDVADAIVSKAIKEGMQDGLYYKDVYKLAKARVEAFAELRGQTYIPTTQLRIEA
jgi:phage regulator Rha-like protein